MNYYFVNYYQQDSAGNQTTSYVSAPTEAQAVQATRLRYPASRSHQAFEIPEIPQDCPYFNQEGKLMSALADQPCEPVDACKTHGRCWTHSVDEHLW
jgi:hypothetical protein